MAKLSIEEIVAALGEMTVVELNELVKAVEEKFGVTAAAPVAAAAAPAEEEEAKGPSEVSLFLKGIGAQKVQVIKAVQTITGLSLLEANKLVTAIKDGPVAIKEHIAPNEASEYKKALDEAGAESEIK